MIKIIYCPKHQHIYNVKQCIAQDTYIYVRKKADLINIINLTPITFTLYDALKYHCICIYMKSCQVSACGKKFKIDLINLSLLLLEYSKSF